MPGPAPKPSALRQRRNKTSTASTLPLSPGVAAPPLPERAWHPRTIEWWTRAWASPMAREWLSADIPGLELVAELWDDLYNADNPSVRVKISAELRLQEARFGLAPMDRRRLQWEIDRGDEADTRTRRRRRSEPAPANDRTDPRKLLGS
jgi:hypothetical protein